MAMVRKVATTCNFIAKSSAVGMERHKGYGWQRDFVDFLSGIVESVCGVGFDSEV
jgi:hypothetical protein